MQVCVACWTCPTRYLWYPVQMSGASGSGLQIELVEVDNGGKEELNFILGQAHFIKSAEDLAEALFQSGEQQAK